MSDRVSQMSEEDEISLKHVIVNLRDWIRYLASNYVIISIFALIGLAAGVFYASLKKTTYSAELTFVLEEGGGGSMGAYASLAGQFGVDLGGSSSGIFEGDNLIALMQSRSMIQKALLSSVTIDNKEKTLAELFIDISDYRDEWRNKNSEYADVHFAVGTDPNSFSLSQNSLISSFTSTILAKNLSIEKKNIKSGIISLKVISVNELFSLYFTNALAKEVSDYYIETKTKKSMQNLSILQHQTDSVKRAFNGAVSEIALSTDATPNPNPSRVVLRVPSQRKQIDVQINTAVLTQLVQNLEIAKVSLRKETPLIQIIDPPILPLPSSQSSPTKMGIIGILAGLMISVAALSLKKIYKNIMS